MFTCEQKLAFVNNIINKEDIIDYLLEDIEHEDIYEHFPIITHDRFSRIWYGMIYRGAGKLSRENYYDRGIRVCDRWRNFTNFKEDMYEDYIKLEADKNKLTIERINNNSNYCPENCRWATMKEQSNNTRRNIILTNPETGETKTLPQWCDLLNIDYERTRGRIKIGYKSFKEIFHKGRLKSGTLRKK